MPPIEFLAEQKYAGKTVAAVLRDRFKLSWNQAKRLVDGGHVRVAGFPCNDVAKRIKRGNRIWVREGTVTVPSTLSEAKPPAKPKAKTAQATPKPPAAKPAAKPIDPLPFSPDIVVYSDDAVVVVNKPAGLTTQRHAEEIAEFGERGQAYLPKTLADFLPRLLGSPSIRVIPVHRIDRDTSGLVVFARTVAAAADLTRQFRKHTADRRYLALTRGIPPVGRIESVLVRDRGDGRRGSADSPAAEDGKRAVTYVKVLEPLGAFACVECRLETGRTHQVRIHLGEAGTPLCGERVYDRPINGRPVADTSGANRPMLHAARLGFVHPESGEKLSWDVPAPADFHALLTRLRTTAVS
ncbi:MAG: RluA family pseudouridine synthase [Bacteroidales bacterium]|nr:RluA family pseudouridine synthase [Bacteroidales bacterium]